MSPNAQLPMKHLSIAAAPAALLLTLAASNAFVLEEGVKVGELVDYSFQSAPIGALGASSMTDLRGKPVLIDFWGRN